MAKKPDSEKAPSRLDDRKNMRIVLRSLKGLIPYARNSRTHSQAQIKQIAGNMKRFGWTNPMLIDEHDGIIAGHGRVMAADMLGLREDVPCIVLSGLSDGERRALVIADNKLAENAAWDNEMLVMELGDITDDGIDLPIVGFSPQEMDALLGVKDEGQGSDDTGPSDNFASQYAVMVTCKSEPDQERIYNELRTQGYDVKVVAV